MCINKCIHTYTYLYLSIQFFIYCYSMLYLYILLYIIRIFTFDLTEPPKIYHILPQHHNLASLGDCLCIQLFQFLNGPFWCSIIAPKA